MMWYPLVSLLTARSQQEAMVLEWLFAPVRQLWADPQWQQRALKDAATFSRLLAHTPGTPEEDDFWFLYHALMLFERCMRRAPVPTPPPPRKPPLPLVLLVGVAVLPGRGWGRGPGPSSMRLQRTSTGLFPLCWR